MPAAFLIGVAAGYAIAIPVGPIAVLIVRTGLERGMRIAALAAAGTATADFAYATVALLVGSAAAAIVGPVLPATRLVAAAVLIVVAVRLLMRRDQAEGRIEPRGGVYFTFLLLTLLNPATVVYFVALVVALPEVTSLAERGAFIVGAGLASLSWQELLAATGAALRGRLPSSAQRISSAVGGAIILLLALRVVTG